MEARAVYTSAYTVKIFLQTTVFKIDSSLSPLAGHKLLKEEILRQVNKIRYYLQLDY
jgi:hypothetical protein